MFLASFGALPASEAGLESGSSLILFETRGSDIFGAGLGSVFDGAGSSFGGSFGAVLTFQSGLILGAPWDLVAVKFRKSLSKKMSKLILGIWNACEHWRKVDDGRL